MEDSYIGITRQLNIVKDAYSNIDAKYGPYDNIGDALAAIPISLRKEGLTVGILINHDIIEYWFDGGVEDIHLVQKTANRIFINTDYFDIYENGELINSSTKSSINDNVITLIDFYTKELVNFEVATNYYDGTIMTDSKIDNVIYCKKNNRYYVDCKFKYNSEINVLRFGADRQGLSDSTIPIQKAFDAVHRLYSAATASHNGYLDFNIPTIIIPNGRYLCNDINIYSKTKIKGIGQPIIKSFTGTKDIYSGYFVNNQVTNIEVEDITFLYFDTVFRIPTGNIDFSFITFRGCRVAACNLFVDTVGFAESRSTTVLFERCNASYGLKQFAKIYCDKSEFRGNWFTHNQNTKFMEIDSFAHFHDNVWVPVDNLKMGSRCWIYFEPTDDARNLLFTNERFGGESGQCPIVVVGDANTNFVRNEFKSQGITFTNCQLNSNGAWNPDGIVDGSVKSAVILQEPTRTPSGGGFGAIDFIKFEGCKIAPLIFAVATYNAPNFKDRVSPDFTIELDKTSSLAVIKGHSKTIVSTDLARYLYSPLLNKNTVGLNQNGKAIKALDTLTAGMKKISFRIRRTENRDPSRTISKYHTGITYLATFIGLGDSSYDLFTYGYSSTYILTISGGGEASIRSKISFTKLSGDTGGAALEAKADIVSAHWGLEETGSDKDPANITSVLEWRDVTITFGTRMKEGYVILTPLYDFDLRI